MVKHFRQEIRKEEYMQEDKLIAKAELLRKLRRIDLIKDQKKNCLRRAIPYVKPKANIHEFLYWESKNKLYAKADETAKEVHAFKTALGNVEAVLKQLTEMQIRNERPADYLVEMYKSDKQMFKVRKHLIVKQQQIKDKMQGKDWESKNKRRQKAKKKAEAKRQQKKARLAANKTHLKPKKKVINGKKKIKRG